MSDMKQSMKEGRWAPDECPITGKPFFLWLSHPEFGYVPTYGGPFDSFMIAKPDEDGYYRAEHYCHDRGDWIEGGTPVTVRKELKVTAEIEIAAAQGADARITSWEALFDRVALALNCLPSSFVDGNDHVFSAIEKLLATRDAALSEAQDAARYRHLRENATNRYGRQPTDEEFDEMTDKAIAAREKT